MPQKRKLSTWTLSHHGKTAAAEALIFCRTFYPWRIITGRVRVPIIGVWKSPNKKQFDKKPPKNGEKTIYQTPLSWGLRGLYAPVAMYRIHTMLTLMKRRFSKYTGDSAMYQVTEQEAKRFFAVVRTFVAAGERLANTIRNLGLENDPQVKEFIHALEDFRAEVAKYVPRQPVV